MRFKNLYEVEEFIDKLIRQYIYDFKFERINICFFKRNYTKCTEKQIKYLEYLLSDKFSYELTDKQIKYLSKLSIKEISILISTIKDIEIKEIVLVEAKNEYIKEYIIEM